MKIAFTGGGTAGHAMANKVLISFLNNAKIVYIGSKSGMEVNMFKDEGVYYPISTGKLRRYVTWKNLMDGFRVIGGIIQAYNILKKEEVNVIFSSGGYVAFPVVVAGWLQNIPVVIRETDVSMGLANRWGARFASKIFTTFRDTLKNLECLGLEGECGGLIVRRELLSYCREREVKAKSRILVMGGSLGAMSINKLIWDNVRVLCERFHVVHIVGRGNGRAIDVDHYEQFEYCDDMGKLYFESDIVVTRCGANAVSECLALGKKMVCIPLSLKSSRGEQFANGEFAVNHGCGVILQEDCLCLEGLLRAIETVRSLADNLECVMGESDLERNCMNVVRYIHALGFENYEDMMSKKVKNCARIDWEELSEWEIQVYEDMMELYY